MRRLAARGTAEYRQAQAKGNERRRRRYPVPRAFLPTLNRPLTTATYGVVIFTEVSFEEVPPSYSSLYPHMGDGFMEFVWARWRTPTLAELVSAWPSRAEDGRRNGWWFPTLDELRDARKKARSRERRQPSLKAGRARSYSGNSKGI